MNGGAGGRFRIWCAMPQRLFPMIMVRRRRPDDLAGQLFTSCARQITRFKRVCAHRRREKCGRRLTARQQEGFRRGIASPPPEIPGPSRILGRGRGCCDFWGRCACRDVRPRVAFVVVGPTTTLLCRRWSNHDIPPRREPGSRAWRAVPQRPGRHDHESRHRCAAPDMT